MKKFSISLIILLFSILVFNSVYASSFNFTATPNLKEVAPGEEVLITLKVSDIDAGEEGINVVETNLEYDKDIIESIEFVDKNNWKSTYNPTEGDLYGKLLYTKMVIGVKDDQDIGALKIKIKNNLDNFVTDIKLLQVTSNDGYTLMNCGDKKITLVYIKKDEPDDPVKPDDSVKPDEPKKEEAPEGEQKVPEETQKKSETPVSGNVQTGDIIVFVSIILVLFILIYIIVRIVGHKHDKNNKSKK